MKYLDIEPEPGTRYTTRDGTVHIIKSAQHLQEIRAASAARRKLTQQKAKENRTLEMFLAKALEEKKRLARKVADHMFADHGKTRTFCGLSEAWDAYSGVWRPA